MYCPLPDLPRLPVSSPSRSGWLLLVLVAAMAAGPARARVVEANPGNYQELLATLEPGDTLKLEPGEYRHGLKLHDVQGKPGAPLLVAGPDSGAPAVFVARRNANTISIRNAAYIHLRDLKLDGRGIPVDAVKLEGTARYAHHVTLENLDIAGHGANQQIVGISTKAPAWGWIIRGNRIHGAGTGMYLGNSDGSAPFFDGVIEHNLVTAPLGYAIQIKHQMPRPALEGAPRGKRTTIIRHNVLSKSEGGSAGADARPNLLLGHWPKTGDGSTDEYQVYGNFLDENPNEALFQAEGNVAFYSNVLKNRSGPGIVIQPHNDVPREIRIFDNTVIAAREPIAVRVNEHTPQGRQVVFNNAVFSPHPIRGGVQRDNATFSIESAATMLVSYPSPFDPFPRDGRLLCPLVGMEEIKGLSDARCDFNGSERAPGYCGAYAGQRTHPGWLPTASLKPPTVCQVR